MKRTPLTRRTPLRRGGNLRRTGKLDRTGPVNPYSDRRADRDADYLEARAECWRRARYRCTAQVADGCTGQAEQCHHIGGRGGDDPHRQDNLLSVCRVCHPHIHANPAEAYELGLMTRRTAK